MSVQHEKEERERLRRNLLGRGYVLVEHVGEWSDGCNACQANHDAARSEPEARPMDEHTHDQVEHEHTDKGRHAHALAARSEPGAEGLREALTSEDEIAHGEAVVERGGARVGLGVCAYCDDEWPCRTQRGINRLLARLAATPAADSRGLDVERLARALQTYAQIGDWTRGGIKPEWATEIATNIAREYAALTDPDPASHGEGDACPCYLRGYSDGWDHDSKETAS